MNRFTAIAILISCNISYSQSSKFSFKLGSEYVLPRKTENLAFFGNETDGIVNLSLKKDELFMFRFDPHTLVQTKAKTIELPEYTKNFNSELVADLGLNYYWLHSDWDKDAEREILYYDKIDVSSGKLVVSNKKLFSATKISGNVIRYKVDNKYNFNFDAGKNFLLVNYRLVPEDKNDKKNFDKIGLQVFDTAMNKVWGGEFKMPYTEAVMDNIDFSIDAKGNAYLLAKVFDSDKRKEKDNETGKPLYHFEVLKFSKGKRNLTHTVVNIGDFFIQKAAIIENSLHEMVIACTYSKKAKSKTTDGVFLALLDTSGIINKYKNGYYEFPLDEMKKYESGRYKRSMQRKLDYEIPNLEVRNILVNQDGSLFMGFEEFEIIVNTYVDSKGLPHTTYQYYYQNIYGARINSSGKFEWMRKIPKYQVSYDRPQGTLGYKLINDANGYYFLFLDHKKNLELAEDEVPKRYFDGYGGQIIISKIDLQGNVSKDLLFDTHDEDLMIYPSQFNAINGNQFIGRADIKRGGYKPLLITIND